VLAQWQATATLSQIARDNGEQPFSAANTSKDRPSGDSFPTQLTQKEHTFLSKTRKKGGEEQLGAK